MSFTFDRTECRISIQGILSPIEMVAMKMSISKRIKNTQHRIFFCGNLRIERQINFY